MPWLHHTQNYRKVMSKCSDSAPAEIPRTNGRRGPEPEVDKVNRQVLQDLFDSASLRDKVRLQAQGQKHAGAWINVVPNENLGLHFGKGEFQLPSGNPNPPSCSGWLTMHQLWTTLGHLWGSPGLLPPVRGLETPQRSYSTSAGLNVTTEVQVERKQRPADLLLLLLFPCRWSHPKVAKKRLFSKVCNPCLGFFFGLSFELRLALR
jgi:hypothetical protein